MAASSSGSWPADADRGPRWRSAWAGSRTPGVAQRPSDPEQLRVGWARARRGAGGRRGRAVCEAQDYVARIQHSRPFWVPPARSQSLRGGAPVGRAGGRAVRLLSGSARRRLSSVVGRPALAGQPSAEFVAGHGRPECPHAPENPGPTPRARPAGRRHLVPRPRAPSGVRRPRAVCRWRVVRPPGLRCGRRPDLPVPRVPAGASGIPHVVVWPADGLGDLTDRRHWHTPCWRGVGDPAAAGVLPMTRPRDEVRASRSCRLGAGGGAAHADGLRLVGEFELPAGCDRWRPW